MLGVDYVESITDLIGNTPLIKLRRVTDSVSATVLAKVEYFNPGGSVKDRIAIKIIDAAEKSGDLQPGGTIVEPTSGNTGVGLALVAQQRGYHCIFVCPDKVSKDKRDTLEAYGAEVVVTPTSVAPDHPDSYYSVSDRLAKETPGGFKPDQYSNPNGPASHYESTGPEIWRATDGKVTHFVAGVGTGGTISGTGKFLKEVSADRTGGPVRVVGVDPDGSIYSGGDGRPFLVEGVGEDFWPDAYDPSVPDQIEAVSDAEAFWMTRRLAREEGLLVGGSCGMAVVAALRVAKTLGPDDVVVVILPDSGRGYLSKIFNDKWMASYGFTETSDSEPTVHEVYRSKSGDLPALVHALPGQTVREAINTMRQFGVSQIPVVNTEPPVKSGEILGSLSERELTEALFAKRVTLSDAVSGLMEPSLPMIGSGEPVSALYALLGARDAAMVIHEGLPLGVLSRSDLLEFSAS